MTAKEYLRSIQGLDKLIDAKLEQAQRLRSQAERITSVMNPNRGSGRTVRDASAGIDRLIDLEREINEKVDQLVDRKREAETAIRTLKDGRERLVLEYRYLNGYDWEWIAKSMHYDVRTLHRIHGYALAKLEVLESCHEMSHRSVV